MSFWKDHQHKALTYGKVTEKVCVHCGKSLANMSCYMLENHLWLEHFDKKDLVHLACVEDKIGRKLRKEDFTYWAVNWWVVGHQQVIPVTNPNMEGYWSVWKNESVGAYCEYVCVHIQDEKETLIALTSEKRRGDPKRFWRVRCKSRQGKFGTFKCKRKLSLEKALLWAESIIIRERK